MTDSETGEWDIDMVVVDGRVEYVDLRVKPNRLTAFLERLVDDVDADRASAVRTDIADRADADLDGEPVGK